MYLTLSIVQFACGGWDLPARPRSIDDVRTFIKSLKGLDPVPDYIFKILDALDKSGAESQASYTDVRVPPCHLVKYHEKKDILPTNFVAIGDSVSRVNPIRG